MGLLDLYEAGKTKLNGVPIRFELGFLADSNSPLHNTTSLNGDPAFSTYPRPYLRTLRPVNPKYRANLTPKKYLDNPPK